MMLSRRRVAPSESCLVLLLVVAFLQNIGSTVVAFSPLSPVILQGQASASGCQSSTPGISSKLGLFSPFAKGTTAEDTATATTTIIQTEAGPMTMPSGASAPVVVITSPQELADFLSKDDRLCVIKFHASWCKSCQKFGLKFKGLAKQRGDWVGTGVNYDRQIVRRGDCRFASIEIGTNLGMCQHLKIKTLPFVHLYTDGEQLAGFPCGPSRFYRLKEQVQYFQDKLAPEKATKQYFHDRQPLAETTHMFRRMTHPESASATATKPTATHSNIGDHSAIRDAQAAIPSHDSTNARSVFESSVSPPIKVAPSSHPTTFTPELLEEMIALDVRGELKTKASPKKTVNKKHWGINL